MAGWRPWRALRERPDIDFRLADFPDGPVRALFVRCGDRKLILIDRRLSPVDRLAALAHELVHIERGGISDCFDVCLEERRVDSIVASRLVPVTELAQLVQLLAELEGGVTAEMVADEFEVPIAVARRALRQLAASRDGQREELAFRQDCGPA